MSTVRQQLITEAYLIAHSSGVWLKREQAAQAWTDDLDAAFLFEHLDGAQAPILAARVRDGLSFADCWVERVGVLVTRPAELGVFNHVGAVIHHAERVWP